MKCILIEKFLLQTVKQIKTTYLNVTVCVDKNQCDKTNCQKEQLAE